MKAHLHTPTPNLDQSLSFYTSLGFEVVLRDEQVIVSDGQAIIEINPDRYARAGVKLYSNNWPEALEDISRLAQVHPTEFGYLLADPSNVWIYLMNGECPFKYDKSESSFSALGKYAGLSLESLDLAKSMSLWQALGYTHLTGAVEQGWVALTNEEGDTVSLMKPLICPHMFFNPSLTYFNGGKNLPVIEKIREAGVGITEEITHFNQDEIVDNVIIRDPGGYGFFIFND